GGAGCSTCRGGFASTAALRAKWRRASAGFAHVGRLRTLGTLGDLVLYLLAFREAAEALRLDCGVVDEYVLAAAVRRDETESLRIVEPLHDPGRHRSLPGRRIGRLLMMAISGGLRDV